jgi:hypothetical protein
LTIFFNEHFDTSALLSELIENSEFLGELLSIVVECMLELFNCFGPHLGLEFLKFFFVESFDKIRLRDVLELFVALVIYLDLFNFDWNGLMKRNPAIISLWDRCVGHVLSDLMGLEPFYPGR